MRALRDTFITDLLEIAKKDANVILMSADMGAPSLDVWRKELPSQFISAGISEQNAINVAAGLSHSGKKVYVYFMACWAARCFEQIRYSCAMAGNPVTILGTGVGLGYAPAGPAHEPTEDIAYMRSINGMEICSPANISMTKKLVKLTHTKPALRYIRLERVHAKEMEEYAHGLASPIALVRSTPVSRSVKAPRIALLSSGYLLGRALAAQAALADSLAVSVFDVWKIKPLDAGQMQKALRGFTHIVTLEEQTLSGGFGSAICEAICDKGMSVKVLRLGLPERYIFENGTRDELLDVSGLSVRDIVTSIKKFR